MKQHAGEGNEEQQVMIPSPDYEGFDDTQQRRQFAQRAGNDQSGLHERHILFVNRPAKEPAFDHKRNNHQKSAGALLK